MMMRFQNRQELDQARVAYKKALDLETKKILICAGTGCVAGGSLKIYDRFLELMQERGIRCEVRLEKEPHDESIGLKKSGCHGFCEMGPLVRLEPGGYLYIKVKPEDCEEILEKTVLGGEYIERLAYKKNGQVYSQQEEIPLYKKPTRNVLEHCAHIDANSLEENLARG